MDAATAGSTLTRLKAIWFHSQDNRLHGLRVETHFRHITTSQEIKRCHVLSSGMVSIVRWIHHNYFDGDPLRQNDTWYRSQWISINRHTGDLIRHPRRNSLAPRSNPASKILAQLPPSNYRSHPYPHPHCPRLWPPRLPSRVPASRLRWSGAQKRDLWPGSHIRIPVRWHARVLSIFFRGTCSPRDGSQYVCPLCGNG